MVWTTTIQPATRNPHTCMNAYFSSGRYSTVYGHILASPSLREVARRSRPITHRYRLPAALGVQMSPSCDNWSAWDGWANWHGQTWNASLISREQREDGQSPWQDHPSESYTSGITDRNGEQPQNNSASPPASYYDAATWGMVPATYVPSEGAALDQNPQSAPNSSLRHYWPTSATLLCHAQTPDEAGFEGLMQTVNGQAAHSLDTSLRHHSGDTASTLIVNSDSRERVSEPPYPGSPAEPVPRRQSPRFVGDEYTARWVRGNGTDRAGWCRLCSSWHKLKDSAYWYHMHYSPVGLCRTPGPLADTVLPACVQMPDEEPLGCRPVSCQQAKQHFAAEYACAATKVGLKLQSDPCLLRLFFVTLSRHQ
ncbi:hypothetical protein CERZMDRAFT_119045 [Cercospora zeae-maydis SCOH1-5]|uniref:Transcription regulator Rua1 C-terminal domain-containing protein n=1 Tax=Cercospora zeae-maydis SCOH1-5 TaxID=717836 RepID=A0A6A6F1Y3_9PEZI|nr:hypothetical protein CERZMDRAFT_119045 [Cercospora zeae-maydis SCOH1-5]